MLVPQERLVSTIPTGAAVKKWVLPIQIAAEQMKEMGKTG
jgi:hypothetical protein